jgi:hypothetical protein
MRLTRREVAAAFSSGLYLSRAFAQSANAPENVAGIPVNYDESKVGKYTLPDPLRFSNGQPVKNAKDWSAGRRSEIVRLYEENQFGASPVRAEGVKVEVFEKGAPAYNGAVTRKQVTIRFSRQGNGPKADVLIYLPAQSTKPVPVLLTPSFIANSTMVSDPGVKPGEIWDKDKKRVPAPRESRFSKLDVERICGQGIGIATVYYGDIDPDFDGGLAYGIRAAYLKPGQTQPAPGEWGTIAAWAWGLSRIFDYLQTDKDVDSKRIGLFGVSRLGKTVLWAGAHDPRFSLVIASCSGEGGAALSRRNYGETVAHLTAPGRYPYQFCANYAKYGNRVDQLPIDGHMLASLIAPRPLLLQTGDTDRWSDPKGEFLAAVAATPVYRLFGKEGITAGTLPAAGQPTLDTLAYFMHSGGHGALPSDWDVFLKFLGVHWGPKATQNPV